MPVYQFVMTSSLHRRIQRLFIPLITTVLMTCLDLSKAQEDRTGTTAADAVTPVFTMNLPMVCPVECDCFNYHETVDCSRRDLDQIPASLPSVVRRLYIEGNRIEDLGDGRLSAAANLTVLIVEDNQLTELNVDALCRLTRLQELDASGNQIQTIFTVGRCGAKLSALKEINLSHNRLTTLPANLSAMAPNLEILLVSHNEITSAAFDASYASLSLLRHVDLAHNDFRRLRVSDLAPLRSGHGRPAVEYLSLADCGLVQIDPGAFDGLDNLTSLTLSRCLVNETVLARALTGASFRSTLFRLDISETFISNLSVELVGSFSNLVGLFASYCDLAAVDPLLFKHIPLLETLDVDGGRLERLDGVGGLTKLRRLSAHMNQLTELVLGSVDMLETIDLSYNRLRRLPAGWLGDGVLAGDVQMLNLSHNELDFIERQAISRMSVISTLDLSHNRLGVFPDFGALRLARLDLSHNGMMSIAEGAFDTLHETLNELDLGYNDFQRFGDVFLDFRMLQYLGLAHNRLGQAFASGREQLGHLFDSLQLLQVLDISYNGISVIQPADLLAGLHHLNTLYVEGNLIRTLADSAIESTRVLAKLVVSGNQLTAPDAGLLTRLEYLEEIDVGNNPFECTCTLQPFLTWANTTPVLVLGSQDISRYQCQFPPSVRGKSIFSRSAQPSGRCPTGHRRGSAHDRDRSTADGRRTAVVYVLAAVACITGAAATLTGGALVCRYGQLCQRVKGLRYRWQIRYREVSNVETAGGSDVTKLVHD